MQIPYVFQNAVSPIALAELDANFAAVAAAVNSFNTPSFVQFVGGSANAITLTPDQPIGSYVRDQTYLFIPLSPNTGATTIAVSGLTPRNLLYADGTPMTGGELLASAPYMISDNGSNYVLMNSAQATGIVPWTPVLSFGGSTTGITYSLQTGISCKIGRIVFQAWALQLTSKGAQVGQAIVGGLPYTVNPGWIGNNGGPLISGNLTFAAGYNSFGYGLGTKSIILVATVSASPITVFTDVAFSNTTLLAGSGFYAT